MKAENIDVTGIVLFSLGIKRALEMICVPLGTPDHTCDLNEVLSVNLTFRLLFIDSNFPL